VYCARCSHIVERDDRACPGCGVALTMRNRVPGAPHGEEPPRCGLARAAWVLGVLAPFTLGLTGAIAVTLALLSWARALQGGPPRRRDGLVVAVIGSLIGFCVAACCFQAAYHARVKASAAALPAALEVHAAQAMSSSPRGAGDAG
jgi:hypothetical protein